MPSLTQHGIHLRSQSAGNHKTLCPECSTSRKSQNRRDPCLSVTIEPDGNAVWNCHNCGWSGATITRSTTDIKIRPKLSDTGLPEKAVNWFASRGIGEATLKRNWIGFSGDEVEFPYFRDGQLVNIKYRTEAKRFRQTAGADKVFYGLDDIAGETWAIITEGEMDKLALEEAGYINVLSVPDGAPKAVKDEAVTPEHDTKFSYVWNCKAWLDPLTKIILAVDGDGPGKALEEELARRLGRDRCWRVTWPNLNDVASKDANATLMDHGPEVLREVIDNAQPFPIKSLFDAGQFESETMALYRGEWTRGCSTGWFELDEFMTIRPGELSIVTGYPGSGKSEFVDAVLMNLAREQEWRFAVCSFENPPAEHIAKLAEKYLLAPFWEGPSARATEAEVRQAMTWLKERFFFIRADDESPTIDWILEAAKGAVMRHGVKGLVIDPYNEIDHKRPVGMTETEYVSQILAKVKRFAQNYSVHVWFIAHPAKPQRGQDGKIPVPSLYDISGSAHWVNKADIGLVVHRQYESNRAEIHVNKVRHKVVGKPGMVRLSYNRAIGTYRSDAA
ncbi:MAG: toprim domain-containing protein [Rhodospirillaceae bacterium]|jgi:twinkle protein|nr:toprim domain-containing protein [Rhodospirillaceae bacterium]